MSPRDILTTLKRSTDEVIVGASTGKDSTALIHMAYKAGFKVHLYYLYIVEDLEMHRTSLRQLEKRYETEILRMPHPDLSVFLADGVWGSEKSVKKVTHPETLEYARWHFGCRWVLTGQKKGDSLQRRGMISSFGEVDHKRQQAHPLAEWNDRQVFSYLRQNRLSLPPEYSLFGRAWNYKIDKPAMMKVIKEKYPDDYRKLMAIVPIADAVEV